MGGSDKKIKSKIWWEDQKIGRNSWSIQSVNWRDPSIMESVEGRQSNKREESEGGNKGVRDKNWITKMETEIERKRDKWLLEILEITVSLNWIKKEGDKGVIEEMERGRRQN